MDADYLALLDEERNLIPIVSIEGKRETTDARRGEGVYDRLHSTMRERHNRGLLLALPSR